MVVQAGGLIEVADYNALALEINRLFSDNTSALVYSTSNVLLFETIGVGGETGGATRVLSPAPITTDHIVVIIDGITLATDRYSINFGTGVITFTDAIAPSAVIVIYNRTAHRYGWGQQASVYPIATGNPILADEATLQAYIEANVNNIIDKVNIIEERIDGPTALGRVAQGNLIRASDKATITSTLATDVLTVDNYWQNAVATVTTGVTSFTRTADWANQLVGVMRYTWASYDQMRYFFNSGNDIRAAITMTGDPLNQGYNNWNQVATQMGTLLFNYNSASQTGTGGYTNNIGAYDLSDTAYQTIFTSNSPLTPVTPGGDYDAYATYVDLVMLWEAQVVEALPAISIDIRITMNDLALNADIAAGTTTFTAGYKLADAVTNNSATFSAATFAPTITVLEDFVTGGNDS